MDTSVFNCRCGLERDKLIFGQGAWHAFWWGPAALLFGGFLDALMIALLVVPDVPVWGRAIAAVLLALVVGFALRLGFADGHRGWCALRVAGYFMLAGPAAVVMALPNI